MKLCAIEGCGRKVHRAGLCAGHACRKARGLPVNVELRRKRPKDAPSRGPCSVLGCYRPEHGNTGICVGHYRRKVTMGKADWARPLKQYRKAGLTRDINVRVSKEIAEILERRAKAEGVDRSDIIRSILEAHVRGALRGAA